MLSIPRAKQTTHRRGIHPGQLAVQTDLVDENGPGRAVEGHQGVWILATRLHNPQISLEAARGIGNEIANVFRKWNDRSVWKLPGSFVKQSVTWISGIFQT